MSGRLVTTERTSSTGRAGAGTPALVLGLLGVGTCWTGWPGLVLGLAAVVAGALAYRRVRAGLATDGLAALAGLGLGVVALVVGALVVAPSFGAAEGGFGDGLTLDECLAQASTAKEQHMCKSQHLAEFNQRFPNAAE